MDATRRVDGYICASGNRAYVNTNISLLVHTHYLSHAEDVFNFTRPLQLLLSVSECFHSPAINEHHQPEQLSTLVRIFWAVQPFA
jgi:hypothetical protein